MEFEIKAAHERRPRCGKGRTVMRDFLDLVIGPKDRLFDADSDLYLAPLCHFFRCAVSRSVSVSTVVFGRVLSR